MAKQFKQFDPWEGKNYKVGIEGNTVFIVGVQHWCDPKFWNCKEENPHKCLEERNDKCTVWDTERYQKNGKCHEWDNNHKIVERCPLYKKCKLSVKCQSKDDEEPYSNSMNRLLQCETNISVYDHIEGKEKRQRAKVFAFIFDALQNLFGKALTKAPFNIKEETRVSELNSAQKRSYWNCIIFSNYIQHYTLYWNYGELNPKELDIEPEKNDKVFEECMKKFPSEEPDVIIVLQEPSIFRKIKGILGNKYIHLKEKSRTGAFYILAKPSSSLYKKIRFEYNHKKTIS